MNEQTPKELSEGEHARLLKELQLRIDTLHRSEESAFGTFGTLDWAVCVGAFLVVPYLLYFWFWP